MQDMFPSRSQRVIRTVFVRRSGMTGMQMPASNSLNYRTRPRRIHSFMNEHNDESYLWKTTLREIAHASCLAFLHLISCRILSKTYQPPLSWQDKAYLGTQDKKDIRIEYTGPWTMAPKAIFSLPSIPLHVPNSSTTRIAQQITSEMVRSTSSSPGSVIIEC